MSALALTLGCLFRRMPAFLLGSWDFLCQGRKWEGVQHGWMVDVYQVGKQNFKIMWVKMGKVIGNKIILFIDSFIYFLYN